MGGFARTIEHGLGVPHFNQQGRPVIFRHQATEIEPHAGEGL
jgi:hypothetical protein